MKKTFKFAALLFPVWMGQMASGQWIINEILADPAVGSDPNGDGEASTTQDEFVELVNMTGAAVDIENWTINDEFGLRHTFLGSTVVADGQAVVVFGGGSPTGTFGGAVVQISSEGSLGLNNSGDTAALYDEGFSLVAQYGYGAEGGNNESLTRDPDITGGSLVGHTTATGAGGAEFSPGTQINGAPFGGETVTVMLVNDTVDESDANPATTGTVTLSSPAVGNLEVSLASSDETEATVPASVTVLSGQVIAEFDVSVVNDEEVDGDQNTSISASAAGFFSGSANLTVTDDEPPFPVVTMSANPITISENGGSATVTIEVDVPNATGYFFTLVSDDTSELTVPGSVTIAPDELSATFTASGVNDALPDGSQMVTITAVDDAAVSLDATVILTVSDDEEFNLPTLSINEIRIDDPGTDDDEYLEIYSETAGVSLDRLTLVVIGDLPSALSGTVERAIALSGFSMNGNYFVVGSSTMTLGVPDLPTDVNVFENSDNLTFLLVSDFTGAEGDDLDTNDDGTLDSMPWATILDGVALYEGIDPPESGSEFEYSSQLGLPRVGPDGIFVPGHIFRSPNGSGDWQIGIFDPSNEAASDTPGIGNSGGVNPENELLVTGFTMDPSNGSGSLTATGLGLRIYVVESSTDLGQSDAWIPLANPATEVDNPDGSVNFNFVDPEATSASRILYRLSVAP